VSGNHKHERLMNRRQWALRSTGLVALWAAVTPTRSARAQDWAKKLFKTHDHNFGTVARAAKAEFVFELENIYEETLHIASVRTSCGCTSAAISKDTLKTWEKGGIVATFNTASFLGQRSATITVTIDKPYFAEVQLNVQGFIRGDVVFAPGVVDFASVDQGSTATKKIGISYAGRPDWQIVDVRSANEHFEVELNETQRGGGKVSYEMVVHLKGSAPEGFIADQLVLVTNDPRSAQVPLAVEGKVVSAVSVSPASLFLGTLEPGKSVTKQLIVKGRAPFTVKEIRGGDDRFTFKVSQDAKTIHAIPVTFQAGEEPGKVAVTLEIVTSLGTITAKCNASATIAKASR
jgi:hypothetical protein